MTNASPTDTSNKSLTRDLLYAAQYYLGRRRVLLLLAAVVIGGGLALKWDWLVVDPYALDSPCENSMRQIVKSLFKFRFI